ncbi:MULTISPECIES: polyphenol oxidase family protein [Trueperella]|uniref:Polyphenol oxidase family protein n=2 Tax=Trueperella bernardiae TaxID=59561 RepID=A0AAW6ZBZ5_9ACTO|nr:MULTISPECIES: polyphenol oxidase family protein [Trueperella]MCM3907263.1 polyphenol oxidase family protein [Trueperella bernardiae]MDK8601232.1 polyphenol oxidase family protein [Trueperella bernardiae]WIM08602.1 polyphenol oxidase family protein [Trueperella bernardiae]
MSSSMIDWFEGPLPPGVRAGFTTVHGGSSTGEYASLNLGIHVGDNPVHVHANRLALGHYIGQEITWMDQVHGSRIVDALDARLRFGWLEVGEADAIALGKGQVGAVMVADCVPLILVEESGQRGAVVHVGRAGLDLGVGPSAVADLEGEVIAILGPSICGRCYEVSEELAEEVGGRWPESLATTSSGTPSLDIPAGLEAQLRACGVRQIYRSDVCTYESADHFSHRRATHAGTQTGRFAGVLQILRHARDAHGNPGFL